MAYVVFYNSNPYTLTCCLNGARTEKAFREKKGVKIDHVWRRVKLFKCDTFVKFKTRALLHAPRISAAQEKQARRR